MSRLPREEVEPPMRQTGRYRFRRTLWGSRVLQAEYLADDSVMWRDVIKTELDGKVFAIASPTELAELRARVGKADERAAIQRRARELKKKTDEPEFEASRFSDA